MRYGHIDIEDLGPYKLAALDLTKVPGPIVGVTGDNGAGKSMLCELLSAGPYRKTQTRGSLNDLATSRTSTLKVRGDEYLFTHAVDPVSRKGESAVFRNGAALTEKAGRNEYTEWAKKHLMPEDVYFATLFIPQQSQGFIGLTTTPRKELLVKALGLEKFERMAKRAGELAKLAKERCDKLIASIESGGVERTTTPEALAA